MEFRVLGPLVVLTGGSPIALRGPQQRLVLALLLAHPGAAISTDMIVHELWGDAAPSSARKAVQSHAAQLRGHLNREGELLIGRDGGYLVELAPGQLDSRVFEAEMSAARQLLETDPESASDGFGRALALWHGAAYEGLAEEAPSLRAEAARLEELRLACLEARFRAGLVVRDPSLLVADIETSVAQHPFRERLRGLQMLALYRSGRQSDALAAYQETRRVLGAEMGLEPSLELQRLEQRILEHDPTLGARDPFAATISTATERRNPYKGLRAFEEGDAADFFGRTDVVDRLVDRLGSRDGSSRFIVLAGPSGSGKSSVIRAGLIPRLRAGAVGRLGDAAVVTMFPGRDPLVSLRTALTEHGVVTRPGETATDGRPMVSTRPLVLVIDQFEELFGLSEPDRRDDFLAALTEMLADAASEVRVIATIRADFLDRPMQQPLLARQFHRGLELLPPLDPQDLRASITEPAARVGVHMEPDLVAEMVHDVAARPAALPLLQYALTDVFERSTADTRTLADYRAAGGIFGALSRRAEDLYRLLDDAERQALRQILLRLVTIVDESQHLRRRVSRSELDELPIDPARVAEVIDRLGAHRLLSFDRDPETGEATVEVPHEALLSEWPRLRDWIEEGRGELVSHRRLVTSATEWLGAGRDDSYTVRGARLTEYEALVDSSLTLTETELDYVRASRTTVDADARAKSRRRRVVLGVLAVATTASVIVAGFALQQRREADEQARVAVARELAAASRANIDTDPERSLLLALEAIDATRTADETVLREAEEALHLAVRASRLLYRLDAGPAVGFSPDGQLLATTSDEGVVRLWEAATGEPIRELVPSLRPVGAPEGSPWPIIDVAFSGDGSRLAASTALRDFATVTWDVATGAEISAAIGHPNPVIAPALSPDGSMLATSSFDTTVRLWDTATGGEIGEFDHGDKALDVSFSPDGSILAVAAGELIHVWDMSDREELFELAGHEARVVNIAFSPDGDRLVSSSLDATARIWELDSRSTLSVLHHPAAVLGVAVDPDGGLLATGAEDGVVRLWDSVTGEPWITLVGHTAPVSRLSFNADGTLLASSASSGLNAFIRAGRSDYFVDEARTLGGSTRVWDVGATAGREPIYVPALERATLDAGSDPTDQVEIADFDVTSARSGDIELSPDGTQLAVSGAAGAVTLWDAGDARELVTLAGHVSRVTGLAFSPDGQQLATAAPDGVRTWDTTSGNALRTLAQNTSLRVSLDWYTDVAFSPDGTLIAATRRDRTVTRFDAATGQELDVVNLNRDEPNDLEFSPDGDTIAIGVSNATMLVDAAAGIRFLAHDATVDNVSFSPDGSQLVTVSRDGKATVWDLTSDAVGGTSIYSINAEQFGFRAVDYDPTGETFATAGEDGTIRIWDATDGSPRLALDAHDGPVIELAHSPDGSRLASISVDGTARLHILDLDEMIELAQTRLTRSFTAAECLQYLHQATCAD